jgi:hypothetical protein
LQQHAKLQVKLHTEVARFFLAQDTKTGRKLYQMTIKYTKCTQHIPNGHKTLQDPPKSENMPESGTPDSDLIFNLSLLISRPSKIYPT